MKHNNLQEFYLALIEDDYFNIIFKFPELYDNISSFNLYLNENFTTFERIKIVDNLIFEYFTIIGVNNTLLSTRDEDVINNATNFLISLNAGKAKAFITLENTDLASLNKYKLQLIKNSYQGINIENNEIDKMIMELSNKYNKTIDEINNFMYFMYSNLDDKFTQDIISSIKKTLN